MEKSGSKFVVEVTRTPTGYARWEGAIWWANADRSAYPWSIPATWVWGPTRNSVVRRARRWAKKQEEALVAENTKEVVGL
jgi:hypothetical protein